jgi:hypothetical protein
MIAFEQSATLASLPAPAAGSSAKTTTAAMTIPVNAAVFKSFMPRFYYPVSRPFAPGSSGADDQPQPVLLPQLEQV